MRDITHTVALRHRDLHTLEHATKHAEPHKCTQAYINTSTHLRAPFVVSVSHSATCTFACNSGNSHSSDDLSNRHLHGNKRLKRGSETTLPAFL